MRVAWRDLGGPDGDLHDWSFPVGQRRDITRRWEREGIFRRLAAGDAAPRWRRRRLEVG
jgi:hypothetical protein